MAEYGDGSHRPGSHPRCASLPHHQRAADAAGNTQRRHLTHSHFPPLNRSADGVPTLAMPTSQRPPLTASPPSQCTPDDPRAIGAWSRRPVAPPFFVVPRCEPWPGFSSFLAADPERSQAPTLPAGGSAELSRSSREDDRCPSRLTTRR
jgi:hypothetical protein